MNAKNPFRYFKTSPEIIQLGVMMYVRFPLSLAQCRRPSSRARDRYLPRKRPALGRPVRLLLRTQDPQKAFGSDAAKSAMAVAPGRGFREDPWASDTIFGALWITKGEVLESYVTKKRDKASALKFLKKAMKRYGNPHVVVTDKCPSYRAAMKMIGNEGARKLAGISTIAPRILTYRSEGESGRCPDFRRMRSLQKFVSVHSSVYNHFNFERHINTRIRFKQKRDAALREWRDLLVA
jgi:putative transposase